MSDNTKGTDGVRLSEDREWITLDGHYEIELSRIEDPELLVCWIAQLTEKNWVDRRMINRFVHKVYNAKGWDIYRRSL